MFPTVSIEMQARADLGHGANTPPLHFIYHVPKCAGRTIDRHLASTLPASAYYRLRKRRGMGRFVTRYDSSRLPVSNATRVVSGHHLGISLDSLFQDRLIKRSMLLRDPASHFVSYYNYRMTRYISEGLQPYGVDVAYGAMRRNFITHYILNNFLELSWVQIASLSDQASTIWPMLSCPCSGSSATTRCATACSPRLATGSASLPMHGPATRLRTWPAVQDGRR